MQQIEKEIVMLNVILFKSEMDFSGFLFFKKIPLEYRL